MAWIPIAAWIVAVVAALVVLGFCAYEIGGKAKRLRADLGELTAVADRLQGLRGQLAEAQQRLAASGLGS
ncbi:MAG: hypothetical protein M3Y06_12755 [Actinomycetota bacterium]|nr:hypothetical protein [Actinomycetota bacterium]